ncbi:hypothetical protein O6H91_21G068000 [Diphasiastrum complanatum]|uniref:Uncharacterized protein n=1 Tax=Diphasiastrum complanatum TaxID=34168 RepID=A0ACC2ALH3_DIPCM|nr:hypothetical protein O6H91_21G068000 [Diphasiastrum complanatum]
MLQSDAWLFLHEKPSVFQASLVDAHGDHLDLLRVAQLPRGLFPTAVFETAIGSNGQDSESTRVAKMLGGGGGGDRFRVVSQSQRALYAAGSLHARDDFLKPPLDIHQVEALTRGIDPSGLAGSVSCQQKLVTS